MQQKAGVYSLEREYHFRNNVQCRGLDDEAVYATHRMAKFTTYHIPFVLRARTVHERIPQLFEESEQGLGPRFIV